MFPLVVPVFFAQAENRISSWRRSGGILLAVMLVFDGLVMLQNHGKITWLYRIHGSVPILVGVLLATLAGLLVMRFFVGRPRTYLAGFVLFVAGTQLVSVLPWTSRTVYAIANDQRQRQVFLVAVQYSHLWEKYADATHRPFLWFQYTPGDYDISSISFMTLGDTLQDKDKPSGMPEINAYELDRLGDVGRGYIFLMAKDQESIARGRAALQDAGLEFTTSEQAMLSSGSLTIYVEVVEYMKFRTS